MKLYKHHPYQKVFLKICSIIFISVIFIGCHQESQEIFLPRPVQYTTVRETITSDTFLQPAKVTAHTDTALSFRIEGKILQFKTDVGSHVKKGQVLATVDVSTRKNELIAAKASLQDAKVATYLAKINYNRISLLANSGAISASEIDQAKANYQSALAKQDNLQASLQNANDNLEYAKIIAPSDGVILNRSANVGQVVTAGQTVLNLAVKESPDVVFQVSESDLSLWKNTKNIQVQLLNHPLTKTSAQLRDISPDADSQTGTWRVRLSLINPPTDIMLGAVVKIQPDFVNPYPNIIIPASALTRFNEHPAVFVITPQSTLKLHAIYIDKYFESSIVVRAGLHTGDRVVTAGVNKLFSGQKVTLQEAL